MVRAVTNQAVNAALPHLRKIQNSFHTASATSRDKTTSDLSRLHPLSAYSGNVTLNSITFSMRSILKGYPAPLIEATHWRFSACSTQSAIGCEACPDHPPRASRNQGQSFDQNRWDNPGRLKAGLHESGTRIFPGSAACPAMDSFAFSSPFQG